MAVGIAGIFLLSLTAARPADLGVHGGRLSDLPSTPNCVSSYATDELHSIQPLTFEGDPARALAKVRDLVHNMAGATLVETKYNYLHVEFRSPFFRFVDDAEFCLDAHANQIHFRSASRTGHSDLEVNRTRMERIRKLFQRAQ
ncbi:MAG TPA: DUF1499 domain-containing protein [Planctomycetes bacterium]|nr:DUF1499 domain-containing protein [Fuerstiella sp.]HIK90394.1 DUF1499 domain-containing protein [Planctomycetota bacterium]